MNYSVGQVLFVVLNKKGQVYPMQVVEEIRKKTLKGEVTTYVLQGGSDTSSTVVLDQVDGEVFESADEVRQTLLLRATNQITKLVATAISKSKEWYNVDSKIDQSDHSLEEVQMVADDPDAVVTLPDGTKARLKSK